MRSYDIEAEVARIHRGGAGTESKFEKIRAAFKENTGLELWEVFKSFEYIEDGDDSYVITRICGVYVKIHVLVNASAGEGDFLKVTAANKNAVIHECTPLAHTIYEVIKDSHYFRPTFGDTNA